jgi:hypothetical protein
MVNRKMSIGMKPVKTIPQAKKGKRGSKYDAVLKQFVQSDSKIVELTSEEEITYSLAAALRQRIGDNEEFSNIDVVTRRIDDKIMVYLKKKK